MNIRSKLPVLAIVAIAIVAISGQTFMTGGVDRLVHHAQLSEDGIDYSFSSSYVTNWTAISMDNGDVDRAIYYVACYDDDHEWYMSDSFVTMVLGHLSTDLSKYGISLIIADATSVTSIMSREIAEDTFQCNIIFLTGSFPLEIYNGTEDSLLFSWLEKGGKMTFANGPIGKYVSNENGLDTVEGFSTLFFGTDAVNDAVGNVHDTRDHTGGIADLMSIYFNECTYGIRADAVDECLTTEYEQDGYYAVAFVRYHSGFGNITVFGGTVDNNSTSYMAQALASGLNYSSEIVDSAEGYGKEWSGNLTASDRPALFIYFGLVTDYTGRYYDFSHQMLITGNEL